MGAPTAKLETVVIVSPYKVNKKINLTFKS